MPELAAGAAAQASILEVAFLPMDVNNFVHHSMGKSVSTVKHWHAGGVVPSVCKS